MEKPHPSLMKLLRPYTRREGEPCSCPECGNMALSIYPWYDGDGLCCHCHAPAAHLPALLEKLAQQSSLNVEAGA
jgi:hypothetical protein